MIPDWMGAFFWVSGARRCGSDSSSLLLLLLLKKRFISLLPGMFSIMLHFYQVFQPRRAAQSGPGDLQHVAAGAYTDALHRADALLLEDAQDAGFLQLDLKSSSVNLWRLISSCCVHKDVWIITEDGRLR